VVAPNDAFKNESEVGTVRRVRQCLESIEVLRGNPRVRGTREPLSFERSRATLRDIDALRERLARLRRLLPELAEVRLATAVDEAAERLALEVS